MANDELEIYNLALNAVGTRSNVSDPSEESREAEVCRLWFGTVRDQVLRAAPWHSAKAYARLAVLAERDTDEDWVAADPEPGFLFAYSAPSDMLYPRHLADYSRFVSGVYNGTTRAIFTQTESAILFYTLRQVNVSLWSPDLKMAIAQALAAYIAMPLHGKASRAAQAQQQANNLILSARETMANEDWNTLDVVPDWLAARGYAGTYPQTRYLYPYGPLISVTEALGVS